MSNSTSRPDLSFLFSLLLLYYIIIINFVVGFSRPLRNVWTDYWSCRKNSETIDPWSDWLPKYSILFGIGVTQIPGQHFKVSRVNPWSDYWSTPFQKLMVEFSGLSDLFEDHLWRFNFDVCSMVKVMHSKERAVFLDSCGESLPTTWLFPSEFPSKDPYSPWLYERGTGEHPLRDHTGHTCKLSIQHCLR